MKCSLTFRMVGQGQKAHTRGTDSWSKNSDAVGITTEIANVLTYPAQSLDLIQNAIIPFSSLVSCAEEACNRVRAHSVKRTCNTWGSFLRLLSNKLIHLNFLIGLTLFFAMDFRHCNGQWMILHTVQLSEQRYAANFSSNLTFCLVDDKTSEKNPIDSVWMRQTRHILKPKYHGRVISFGFKSSETAQQCT